MISKESIHTPPRLAEIRDTLADNSKAKEFLEWQPTIEIEQGIEELKRWLRI